MTVITGTLIKNEYGSDETVVNIEIIIDSAIDTVNSDAGTSIGYMTGGAGAKTITVTGNQAAAIKPLVAIKLASNQVEGGTSMSRSLGVISESSSQNIGAQDSNTQLYERAIKRLIGCSFKRA